MPNLGILGNDFGLKVGLVKGGREMLSLSRIAGSLNFGSLNFSFGKTGKENFGRVSFGNFESLIWGIILGNRTLFFLRFLEWVILYTSEMA